MSASGPSHASCIEAAKLEAEPFSHKPLEDPAKYIRLLEAAPSMEDGSVPSFIISACPIDDAPKYNAISYTWGETDTTTIRINGQPMEVRTNCYKALLQAYRLESTALLWIDSVCINQSDPNEKSHQVAMMFDVYNNASMVLACVGDADDDSKWLLEMCQSLDGIIESSDLRLCFDDESAQLAKRLAEQYSSTHCERQALFIRLQRAWIEFGSRQYWHRAWIMQEVIAGGLLARVLCGHDATGLRELDQMQDIITIKFDGDAKETLPNIYETPLGYLLDVLKGMNGGTKEDLGELLYLTCRKSCQDPRDRVYSILALVDWKNSQLEPIFPDYSITPWLLAEKLVAGLNLESTLELFKALEIGTSTPEMQTLVAQRISLYSSTSQPCQTVEWSVTRVGGDLAVRLSTSEQGTLSCIPTDARLPDPGSTCLEHSLGLLNSPGYKECNFQGLTPRQVCIGNQLVALVCPGASPGDLLVNARASASCLVLRPTETENFDVVGTGLLANRSFCKSWPNIMSDVDNAFGAFTTNLILSVTCEDIMALCYAEIKFDNTSRAHDYEPEELRYIMMRPLATPEGAARLVPEPPSGFGLVDAYMTQRLEQVSFTSIQSS